MTIFESSIQFARAKDEQDVLKLFRDKFDLPKNSTGQPKIYFCGNSLGLQPKSVQAYLDEELQNWRENGVEGHFSGIRPWMRYHHYFNNAWQALIGCEPEEVVIMNNLTVNLHLLMVSFYRPTASRYKIIMEGHAFPSDQYAMASQVMHHGYDPADAIIEIYPKAGAHYLSTDQIEAAIEQTGESLAMVMFSGVQYYTGQFFDLERITEAAHGVGAYAGFDLAHAVGNLPLSLHRWDVDFATWCSYKYLNSGPGAVSGVFIHKKHAQNTNMPRFAGWWGHDEATRFKMEKSFVAMPTAEGWQLSNAPVMNMAAHLASLEIFQEAGIDRLRAKSLELTGYLRFLLEKVHKEIGGFMIITPPDDADHGAQLSILMEKNGRAVFEYLEDHDVVADWREPDVIRIAPVPLYNTFEEVFQFSALFEKAIRKYGGSEE